MTSLLPLSCEPPGLSPPALLASTDSAADVPWACVAGSTEGDPDPLEDGLKILVPVIALLTAGSVTDEGLPDAPPLCADGSSPGRAEARVTTEPLRFMRTLGRSSTARLHC